MEFPIDQFITPTERYRPKGLNRVLSTDLRSANAWVRVGAGGLEMQNVRRLGSAWLIAIAFCWNGSALAIQGPPATQAFPSDVFEFVQEIAEPTAKSPGPRAQRVVTFSRDAKGELVVSGIQIAADGSGIHIPQGVVAVLAVHFRGQCDPPFEKDDYPARKGIVSFISSSSGKRIWEVRQLDGDLQVRLVKSATSFGPWEKFQADPKRYTHYACTK